MSTSSYDEVSSEKAAQSHADFVDIVAQAVIDKLEERKQLVSFIDAVVLRVQAIQVEEIQQGVSIPQNNSVVQSRQW